MISKEIGREPEEVTEVDIERMALEFLQSLRLFSANSGNEH